MSTLSAWYKPDVAEAGCDEAGRGCLAGPVVAAAVVLPSDFEHPLLNDSKQLSEDTRYRLREFIKEHAIGWAVGFVSHEEIRSEEHTSELQSLMRISYAVFCLKK